MTTNKMDTEKLIDLMNSGSEIEFCNFLENAHNLNPVHILRVICDAKNIEEETRCKFATKLLEKHDAHGSKAPFPVHQAAGNGYFQLCSALIRHPKHPANVKVRSLNGETTIIRVVRGAVKRKSDATSEEDALNLIETLTGIDPASVHVRDNVTNKYTAVHLAAKHGLWKLVEFFLKNNANINIQIGDDTARQLIAAYHEDWVKDYAGSTELGEDRMEQLVSELENSQKGKEQIFSKWLEDNKSNLQLDELCKGEYTLLQYAIRNRLPNMAKSLIARNADPNTAFYCALDAGEEYFTIIKESQIKLNVTPLDDLKQTVLHKAVLSECPSVNVVEFLINAAREQENVDFVKWINAKDHNGLTVLHIAAVLYLNDVVILLLKNDANIFIKDDFDLPAFYHVQPELIEEHLDRQITRTEPLKDYGIVFDLRFLDVPREKTERSADKETSIIIYQAVPKDENKTKAREYEIQSEMEPLRMLADSSLHSRLLQHPVIRAFLQLKWQRLYWFYWLNCSFYLAFALSFIAFVFSVDLKHFDGEGTKLSNASHAAGGKYFHNDHHHLFQLTTGMLTFFLALRELSQALFLTTKYICNWENWLEVIIILLTFLLLVVPFSKALASALTLLISLEMFLLMSRHPRLANYIHMFLQVARNFVKFLLWYFLMILAFGFSFYIIFPFCENKDDESKKCKTFFNTIYDSIFKTVVMISGEFEAGEIEFDHVSITSHLIFIAFLFFISIVMVNLLNGLAVSDTQQIKNDAELIFCKSQAKFFHDIESTLLMTYHEGDNCPSVFRSFARWISKKILLINNLLAGHNNSVTVLLHKNNQVIPDVRLLSKSSVFRLFCGCQILPLPIRKICNTFNTIVRDALQVISKNEERRKAVEASEKIEEQNKAIPDRLQRLEELVQTLLTEMSQQTRPRNGVKP
ncbi:transient receptor potential cation channel protein painless-like [Cloeon dipterum]|uniref:transient receptor potential cation channel protein painless-like n=1 Tax=Cloeon dipterum TaxID=197152 RepID=UPI0032204C42